MNGPKTIGRIKPAPDQSKVEEIAAAVEKVADVSASGAGFLTPRERAFHMENIQLKRELAVMTARNNAMMMAGEKGTRPVGNAWERQAEMEERILAADLMKPSAAVDAIARMADDVRKHRKAKSEWVAAVEKEVDRKVGNDP